MDTAMKCGVLSLVYPFLSDSVDYESNAFKAEAKIIARNVRQKIAFDELIERTEQEEIDILMLKEIWIKDLYPEPQNRTMGDIDLYYYLSQKKKLFKLLKTLGYVSEASHD